MIKRLIFISILLPFIVIAEPVDIPVNNFVWTHNGEKTDYYTIKCNGVIVINVDVSKREALISDANLPDGVHSCTISSVLNNYEAESKPVVFFITSGQPMKTVDSAELPVAPVFGVE